MKNEEGTVKAGEKWQQTEKQPLRSCFSKNLLWTTWAYMALSVAYRKSLLFKFICDSVINCHLSQNNLDFKQTNKKSSGSMSKLQR